MAGTVREVVGDATCPAVDGPVVLAHVVNDQGAWGRGFVVAVSSRWPEPEAAYRRWFQDGQMADGTPFTLGRVQLVPVTSPDGAQRWVANLLAQHGLGRANVPLDLDALTVALRSVGSFARTVGATLVCPRIGTGLGGGRWAEVRPLLETEVAGRYGVEVAVHVLARPR